MTDAITRTRQGALERIDVRMPTVEAGVFPHGAHLAHWQPAGHQPVLFLSDHAVFAPAKGIRGGIPICFPWFGGRDGLPAHGFARTTEWEVLTTEPMGDSARLAFQFSDTDATRELWPHPFTATLNIDLGETLGVRLSVENTGNEPFDFEIALHTYFAVRDVRRVHLTGFAGCEYIDTVGERRVLTQQGEPTLDGEVDRIYQDQTAPVTIDDPGMNRRITISKSGSHSTVLWNPHVEKATRLSDFGDDEWPRMLCVETANVGGHAITLASGESHETSLHIEVTHA